MPKKTDFHIPDNENMGQGLRESNLKLYSRIHHFLRANFEKKKVCQLCGEKDRLRYEAALRKGKDYSFNLDDYIELCVPCHRKYDYNDRIRANMSNANKGVIPWNKGIFGSQSKSAKSVAKIDPVTMNVLHVYGSIIEAARLHKITPSCISACTNGKRVNGKSGGFIWKKVD